MTIKPDSACFQNRDPKKNIGKRSGRKFAITFSRENDSYYVYSDGSTELAKKNAKRDLAVMIKSHLNNDEVFCKPFSEIEW